MIEANKQIASHPSICHCSHFGKELFSHSKQRQKYLLYIKIRTLYETHWRK